MLHVLGTNKQTTMHEVHEMSGVPQVARTATPHALKTPFYTTRGYRRKHTSNDIFSKVADGIELFARKAGTGPVKLL